MEKAYLVLSNGAVFEGERFGAAADTVGELVFTTGMGGYIETLTDPSYAGQIILQTFPMIGNFGIIPEDFEGKPAALGYVVREWCDAPSNFRCAGDLDSFLKEHNIPGICGVDTREITRMIREHGVMNAAICDRVPEDFTAIKAYRVTDAVASVSCRSAEKHTAETEKFSVVLIDYGAKANIQKELLRRGCSVTVIPFDTSAEEVLALRPDGIMLSNGPGDPADNVDCIRQLSLLMGKVPMFGICLGHQLLALANGGKTVKLKYGHRGVNQPVTDTKTGRTYMTSQNHGYAVVSESLPETARVSFLNANDQTCEGVEYPKGKAFSVQFHPEARSGPLDTSFLFDRFIAMMEEARNAAL